MLVLIHWNGVGEAIFDGGFLDEHNLQDTLTALWQLVDYVVVLCSSFFDYVESRWSPDFFFFIFIFFNFYLFFFFQASSFQLLKLENLLRWSLFTFSFVYPTSPSKQLSIAILCFLNWQTHLTLEETSVVPGQMSPMLKDVFSRFMKRSQDTLQPEKSSFKPNSLCVLT